jgi:hypothetical protein
VELVAEVLVVHLELQQQEQLEQQELVVEVVEHIQVLETTVAAQAALVL